MRPFLSPPILPRVDPSLSVALGSRLLTLVPLIELRTHPEVIALAIEASFDAEIRAKNYIPHCMDQAQARVYCAESDAVIFCLDGKPVGATVVRHQAQPGQGVEVPAGCVELDEWLMPDYRGQGLMGRRIGWPLIVSWLARRFEHVVSVTWEDNHPAINLLRSRGYRLLGRSFWSGEGYARTGYCEVYLYELAPHRTGADRGAWTP